jgi:hypothetical protein
MDLASSAAGLIGLAGLAVQPASALYTFCRKIPRVAGEVEAIISEVRRLSQTLEWIQHVASDRTTQKLSSRTNGVIAKLQDEIAQCTTDLEAWKSSLAALKLGDGKWAGNALKKLKLAADTGRFSQTRLKISAHKDQLALLIELLTVHETLSLPHIPDLLTKNNRDLEMSTSQVVDGIDSKINDFTAEQMSSQTLNIACLEKIQTGVQAVAMLQSTT